MKKFIKDLFSNRFGIILATLNVCFFVSDKVISRVFEHIHGESCVFFGKSRILSPLMNLKISDIILFQNFPAQVFSLFSSECMQKLFPGHCAYTHIKFEIFFLIFFVVLQWLFIVWLAKTIAEKLQSN
jgi:hypothetical protein